MQKNNTQKGIERAGGIERDAILDQGVWRGREDMGGVFKAEQTVNKKCPVQKHVWDVPGTAWRPVWPHRV